MTRTISVFRAGWNPVRDAVHPKMKLANGYWSISALPQHPKFRRFEWRAQRRRKGYTRRRNLYAFDILTDLVGRGRAVDRRLRQAPASDHFRDVGANYSDIRKFAISHRDEFSLLPMETAKFGNAITESLECLAELPADYRSRP